MILGTSRIGLFWRKLLGAGKSRSGRCITLAVGTTGVPELQFSPCPSFFQWVAIIFGLEETVLSLLELNTDPEISDVI